MEGACYGAYFLEVASWLSDENMDGTELLNLLYVSLKALSKEALPNPLVRRIFELRAMVINGVYTQEPEGVLRLCVAVCDRDSLRFPVYIYTERRCFEGIFQGSAACHG